MKQVQLATGLSTRGFYLIVKKLEYAQLVATRDAEDDRRKRLLSLTDQGLAGVAEMPLFPQGPDSKHSLDSGGLN